MKAHVRAGKKQRREHKPLTPTGKKVLHIVEILVKLLVPVVGFCCLFLPEDVMYYLPSVLGVALVLRGIADLVEAIMNKDWRTLESTLLPEAVLNIILGIVIVLLQEESIVTLGVIWGIIGLRKAVDDMNITFYRLANSESFLVYLVQGVFGLILALLLLISPLANFEHHVVLLGLELIISSLHIKRDEETGKIAGEVRSDV